MSVEDMSGSSRPDKDILEAAKAIKFELVKEQPRPIMLYYPIILDALDELLQRREKQNV